MNNFYDGDIYNSEVDYFQKSDVQPATIEKKDGLNMKSAKESKIVLCILMVRRTADIHVFGNVRSET